MEGAACIECHGQSIELVASPANTNSHTRGWYVGCGNFHCRYHLLRWMAAGARPRWFDIPLREETREAFFRARLTGLQHYCETTWYGLQLDADVWISLSHTLFQHTVLYIQPIKHVILEYTFDPENRNRSRRLSFVSHTRSAEQQRLFSDLWIRVFGIGTLVH